MSTRSFLRVAMLLLVVVSVVSTLFASSARASGDDAEIAAIAQRGDRKVPIERPVTPFDGRDFEPLPAITTEIIDAATFTQPLIDPAAIAAAIRQLTMPAVPPPASNTPAAIMATLPTSVTAWLETHDWTIEWLEGNGPDRVAEARYGTRTIAIWHTTDWPADFWAGAVAHELGHAVSYEHFGDEERAEWNELRGTAEWWWTPGTPTDFWVGEGDFAEAFMNHLLGHPIRSVGGPLLAVHRAWIRANTPF